VYYLHVLTIFVNHVIADRKAGGNSGYATTGPPQTTVYAGSEVELIRRPANAG
jgi:hypothetical protein